MLLIVGLGNPGNKYILTRHNIGFQVVDYLREQYGFSEWKLSTKFESLITLGEIKGVKILLVKPQTFMNNSGKSVSLIKNYYKISFDQMLIIHDDFDLDFGKVKLRTNSSGKSTHNGLRSIVRDLGNPDFTRLRVGISSHPEVKKEAYVLQKFTQEEQESLSEIIKQSCTIITTWSGIDAN